MKKRADKRHLFSDWRDFGREYAIIVLGVLTALIAQSVAEDFAWREKVQAATDDMRQELGAGNGPQNYAWLMMNRCFNDRLAAVKQAVDIGDRAKSAKSTQMLWLPVGTYDNYAWENAVSSEISTHIPRREKYEFRIAYVMTPELDEVRGRMLGELATLRSIPPGNGALSQTEKQIALEAIANLEIDSHRMERASAFVLRHMRNLDVHMDGDQLRRRFTEANMHYAGCLTTDSKVLDKMISGEVFDPR